MYEASIALVAVRLVVYQLLTSFGDELIPSRSCNGSPGAAGATLPAAGTVHNTNTLLGHDGFVGVKTGSTAAAGGCFAFRAIRWIDGKRTTITGVVLGQPGPDLEAAGLAAADAMVDRIAGHRGSPDLGQPTLPPLTAPGIAAAHIVQRTVVNAICTRGPGARVVRPRGFAQIRTAEELRFHELGEGHAPTPRIEVRPVVLPMLHELPERHGIPATPDVLPWVFLAGSRQ